MSKKNVNIDEQTLQESIARGIPQNMGYNPPEYAQKEPIKEEGRKRLTRNMNDEYIESYLTKVEFPARQMIYVSEETHKSLSDIVNVVGGRKANLSSYVENIIRSHFNENKELINGLHKNQYKPPLK